MLCYLLGFNVFILFALRSSCIRLLFEALVSCSQKILSIIPFLEDSVVLTLESFKLEKASEIKFGLFCLLFIKGSCVVPFFSQQFHL